MHCNHNMLTVFFLIDKIIIIKAEKQYYWKLGGITL